MFLDILACHKFYLVFLRVHVGASRRLALAQVVCFGSGLGRSLNLILPIKIDKNVLKMTSQELPNIFMTMMARKLKRFSHHSYHTLTVLSQWFFQSLPTCPILQANNASLSHLALSFFSFNFLCWIRWHLCCNKVIVLSQLTYGMSTVKVNQR